MVPKGGLEPPRVTSHAPQTCASTSSATSARLERISKNEDRSGYFFLGDAVGVATAVAGAVAGTVAAGVG